MRRRLPQGVRMYTGDDFNYRRADRGRRRRAIPTRCSASSMRSRRRPRRRSARSPAATSRRFHEILAPTVPLSRHIFKAPTRFYKTGVVFMAYLNGLQDHFTHGRRPGERALDLASGRAVPSRRCRRAARRSGAGGRAHEPVMATRGVEVMRDLSRDRELLAINTATVKAVVAGASRRGLRARRHHRDRAVARYRAALRASRRRGKIIRAAGLTVTCLCRGGMFPAADEAGRRAALDDNRRAVDEAAASAHDAWC